MTGAVGRVYLAATKELVEGVVADDARRRLAVVDRVPDAGLSETSRENNEELIDASKSSQPDGWKLPTFEQMATGGGRSRRSY